MNMHAEVKRLGRKLAAEQRKVQKATRQKDAIERQLARAMANTRIMALPDLDALSPHVLGELVADAARSHGGECVAYGTAHTSVSWRLFRARLAALVKRAESAPQ